MLDVNMLRPDKGGDPVRAMRARARASRRTPEDVDDDAIERWVTARAQSWTRSARAVARMGDDARARTVTDDDARDARR
jgi:hypothetical protein